LNRVAPNDSTYYFCTFIVVPSANRFGNQIYWNFVRWRLSQKIAKKHSRKGRQTTYPYPHPQHLANLTHTQW
jgi:hypothetical protein